MSDPVPGGPPEVRFEVLDPHDESEANLARLRQYADSWSQAFFDGRLDDGRRHRWLTAYRTDHGRHRAAIARSTLTGADMVVGTCSSWTGEINVGGSRRLPLQMVSDVAVAPTHRRRGIMRRLITDDLAHAAAHGVPLVGLTASEGTIYGRFGFGVATRHRGIEVDVSPRFALREVPTGVHVELADPESAYPTTCEIEARVLADRRGAVSRPAGYEPFDSGRVSRDGDGPNREMRVAIAFDAEDGRPRGFVRYTAHERDDVVVAKVHDLQAVDHEADLALWHFLGHLDLVRRVSARIPPDGVLDLAVVDHEVVSTKWFEDMLWLRVIDPVVALEARPWRSDGSVVVEVDDALGHAAGRFRIATVSGVATVRRTDETAGVGLDAETLAALYLGDRTVDQLASVGRITGPDLDVLAAQADHAGPPPWCTTDF